LSHFDNVYLSFGSGQRTQRYFYNRWVNAFLGPTLCILFCMYTLSPCFFLNIVNYKSENNEKPVHTSPQNTIIISVIKA